FTASPRAIAARLTPTITLLNPSVIALGTIGISLQDVATSGATKASGPPLTVTLGLPTAVDPWEPQYGIGGIRSFTPVGHCVNEENAPLIDSHVAALLDVSMPVTSLRNPSAALGFGISDAIPAMAMLARIVNPIRVRAIGMFVR